jgi:hypothetical protein
MFLFGVFEALGFRDRGHGNAGVLRPRGFAHPADRHRRFLAGSARRECGSGSRALREQPMVAAGEVALSDAASPRCGFCLRLPCVVGRPLWRGPSVRVIAVARSARFRRRLLPRSRRWRSRLPEDAGIGATPAILAGCASVGNRSRSGGLPDRDRGGDGAAAERRAVCIRSNHDHPRVPSIEGGLTGPPADTSERGRLPRSYWVTPAIPDSVGDTTAEVRPRPTTTPRVSPPPVRT